MVHIVMDVLEFSQQVDFTYIAPLHHSKQFQRIETRDFNTMSEEYKGQDLRDIAAKAEQDLASNQLKFGAANTGFGGKSGKGGSLSSTSKWPTAMYTRNFILTDHGQPSSLASTNL